MSTLAIDRAIAKVPFLAESKNIKKTPLSGGITNLNFRIDADGTGRHPGKPKHTGQT